MVSWKRVLGMRPKAETVEKLQERLRRFRDLVDKNDRILELIADAGEKLGGEYVFDIQYLRGLARDLRIAVHGVVDDLNAVTGNRYPELLTTLAGIDASIQAILDSRVTVPKAPYVIPLDQAEMDLTAVVGEKMARLSEVGRRIGCRVPSGFVITAHACRCFLDQAGVEEHAAALAACSLEDGERLDECARTIREQVLRARLPGKLARAIRRAALRMKGEGDCRLLAVRSSALGEDGSLSFAGQYKTVLGVDPKDVCTAYRTVVASLYSSGVVRYCRSRGLSPERRDMAVGCLRMVPAKSSGVVYSLNPSRVEKDALVVMATRGLGSTVVEGSAAADRFEISRDPCHSVFSRKIANKEWMQVALPGRGAVAQPVPAGERQAAAITDVQLQELAQTALRIERYMKCAQDIEWAVDHDGRLFILQTRPLKIPPMEAPSERDMTSVVGRYAELLRGRGEVACRGIGGGPVHVIKNEEGLVEAPAGSVIVARTATPRLAAVLSGASAVITDVGSSTGHLAAVARDLRVPTIVDTGIATQTLSEGLEVTVDAEENVVYRGLVKELLHYQLLKTSSFEGSSEFQMLRRALGKIAPLRLKDPQSHDFTSARCTTYHDIIRFAHEKAITELTGGYLIGPSRGGPHVRRLELPIPLDLTLLNLGTGFKVDERRPTARMADLTSRPLIPLLEELTADGVWETAPADMDLNGFMSSATRGMSLPGASAVEQNLAIVSSEYLHLSLRLGYHFTIVDAYLTERRSDNYTYFRFAGGVTELERRTRRAALLKRVLESYDFVVEGKGDLVIGRVKGLGADSMIANLRMLGRLIGFTRQLDVFLRSDDLVEEYVERFIQGKTIGIRP